MGMPADALVGRRQTADALRSAVNAAMVGVSGVMANLTGNPAMSVPLWWNDDGLPIGAHFLGRFGDEATLIRLASQLEASQPWAGRLPPVHGATWKLAARSSSVEEVPTSTVYRP